MQYGLLKSSSLNLGNEIQSVVVRKNFLPRVDRYLDGDFLSDVKLEEPIKLIIHGAFMTRPDKWPPAPCIDPLFISFFMSMYARETMTTPKNLQYLKTHEPIGCRDTSTLEFLKSKGVDAYFSGCVTFTLPRSNIKRTDEIFLVDLDEDSTNALPKHIRNQATVLHHGKGLQAETLANSIYNKSPKALSLLKATKLHIPILTAQHYLARLMSPMHVEKWMAEAEELLAKYARAKLAITSRLHCALPCAAMGTPVIFVHRNLRDPRFSGLTQYMLSVSPKMFQQHIANIDFDTYTNALEGTYELGKHISETCKSFLKEEKQ